MNPGEDTPKVSEKLEHSGGEVGSERGGTRRGVYGSKLSAFIIVPCTQSLQLCPTLCDPMDCSPPLSHGSSVHGILQVRILEWVAMSSSRDLPDPGIKPVSPASPALQVDFLPTEPPGKPYNSSPTG